MILFQSSPTGIQSVNMSDFIFDVSAPAIDHHMVSLIDPQLTFAASGNNEWKEQHVRQLGWNVVDLPDDLFSSSEHAATIRRLCLVFQGAIQYCKFRERQASFEVGQFKSKWKASKKEVGELFDELVELREVTALMKLKHGSTRNGGSHRTRNSNSNGDRRGGGETLEERQGFCCYICGNAYPSSGPLQSHLKKRHHISSELAQQASARCGVDVYQTAIELQKHEIMREREEARTRELNELRTEVTHVRLAMSDMAAKQGLEAHREIEFSREVLTSSIQQVQKVLAAAAVAAATTPAPAPPQPQQVMVLPPVAQPHDDSLLLSKFEQQERRVRELEKQLVMQQRRPVTPVVQASSEGTAQSTSLGIAPILSATTAPSTPNVSTSKKAVSITSASSIVRRGSKRYDELSEDEQSSLAASPEGKPHAPTLTTSMEIRSLLAPVPILLKLPRSPTVATNQPKAEIVPSSSDAPRQSTSTIEDTKSAISPLSPTVSQREPPQSLSPPPVLNSWQRESTGDGTPAQLVGTASGRPQASADHLSEFVNVEVSQVSLPSKKDVGNDVANRSDVVNMESQRISTDGPVVSSASSTTNHHSSKKGTQQTMKATTSDDTTSSSSSSSDDDDDDSSSSSSSSSSAAPGGSAPPASEAVPPTGEPPKKVKKPSLFSRIIAKVTS